MEQRLIDADALKKKIQGVVENEMPIDEKWALGLKYSLKLIDNVPTVEYPFYAEAYQTGYEEGKNERPQGEWIVTAEDSEGIHRIQCPFCGYEKGSDFIDYIIVTFERFPPFCESCGADMRGNDNEQ